MIAERESGIGLAYWGGHKQTNIRARKHCWCSHALRSRDRLFPESLRIAEIHETNWWKVLKQGSGVAILAVGTMVLESLDAAARLLREGINATVVNCRFLKPFDREVLQRVVAEHRTIVTVEEGNVTNGFGASMAREIHGLAPGKGIRVDCMGMPDSFVEHGARDLLLANMGLNAEGIAARVSEVTGKTRAAGATRESA